MKVKVLYYIPGSNADGWSEWEFKLTLIEAWRYRRAIKKEKYPESDKKLDKALYRAEKQILAYEKVDEITDPFYENPNTERPPTPKEWAQFSDIEKQRYLFPSWTSREADRILKEGFAKMAREKEEVQR